MHLQKLSDNHIKVLKYTGLLVSAYSYTAVHCILSIASDSMQEGLILSGKDTGCIVDIHRVLTTV